LNDEMLYDMKRVVAGCFRCPSVEWILTLRYWVMMKLRFFLFLSCLSRQH